MAAAPYILNQTLLGMLDENWDELGTEIIFGKCCLFSTDELTVAREIRYTANLIISVLLSVVHNLQYYCSFLSAFGCARNNVYMYIICH
jgi:hypothetical protein